MKNSLRLFFLLIVLAATACSKYSSTNNDVSTNQVSYNDSLTAISKSKIEADTNTIVIENNVYRSTMTAEG